MPPAARTAGWSRCRRTPRRAPARTGARGTALADGVAWRSDGDFEEREGRSWRGNPKRAAPERPEDHQTQGASSTYEKRRRPTDALKNQAQRDSANQRRHTRKRMIDAKPTTAMTSRCRSYERALGTSCQTGHHPDGKEQE